MKTKWTESFMDAIDVITTERTVKSTVAEIDWETDTIRFQSLWLTKDEILQVLAEWDESQDKRARRCREFEEIVEEKRGV
jgi:hypothetical protein